MARLLRGFSQTEADQIGTGTPVHHGKPMSKSKDPHDPDYECQTGCGALVMDGLSDDEAESMARLGNHR